LPAHLVQILGSEAVLAKRVLLVFALMVSLLRLVFRRRPLHKLMVDSADAPWMTSAGWVELAHGGVDGDGYGGILFHCLS